MDLTAYVQHVLKDNLQTIQQRSAQSVPVLHVDEYHQFLSELEIYKKNHQNFQHQEMIRSRNLDRKFSFRITEEIEQQVERKIKTERRRRKEEDGKKRR